MTLVRRKAVGSRMERSTWLSAAKWTTASTPSMTLDTAPCVGDVAPDPTVARARLEVGQIGRVARSRCAGRG